jgi:hypothetical protein
MLGGWPDEEGEAERRERRIIYAAWFELACRFVNARRVAFERALERALAARDVADRAFGAYRRALDLAERSARLYARERDR